MIISGPLIALLAALLFGVSTPAAKLLLGHLNPQLLAGLLYLGSGLGLTLISLIMHRFKPSQVKIKFNYSDLPYLAGAIISGGIIAPLLLMIGLQSTASGVASLLLNTEGVFTALLAWFVFKENFDKQIFIGMVAIIIGSALLAFKPGAIVPISIGSLTIIASCFGWALDNNLTRNVIYDNPLHIAALKGLIAGLANCVIAFIYSPVLPTLSQIGAATIIGLFGYGFSLVLFIAALRRLGTARTGAYFSTAPFAGAILAILFLHEPITKKLLTAALFMAIGVYLHLTEKHEHEHSHLEEEHEHMHYHDEHHQHEHQERLLIEEPHSHLHYHPAITHSHPHYPDTLHRHDH